MLDLTEEQRELIKSLCNALAEVGESLKELADELEGFFQEIAWLEPTMKYPFIRSLGNMQYCRNICRKPIHKARSCC